MHKVSFRDGASRTFYFALRRRSLSVVGCSLWDEEVVVVALPIGVIAFELRTALAKAGASAQVIVADSASGDYEDVRLHSEGHACEDGFLYVCSDCQSEVGGILSALSCVGEIELRSSRGCAIRIVGEVAAQKVFSIIQETMLKWRLWEAEMDRSCLVNEGLQRLFDISEGILLNNVVVVDASLKLLAHTRGLPCDDPITVELIKHGYHTEANIAKFKLNKRFKAWATERNPIVNDSYRVCKYVTVVHSFKSKDLYSAIVIMMCSNVEMNDYSLEVLSRFARRVKYYIDKDYPESAPSGNPTSTFLLDLVMGRIEDVEAVESRSRFVGIPFRSRFAVFFVECDSDIPKARILSTVTRLAAPAKVVPACGGIMILCFGSRSDEGKTMCDRRTCSSGGMGIISRLEGVLGEMGLLCGKSSCFTRLDDAHDAFEQARHACRLARLAKLGGTEAELVRPGCSVYSFDDNVVNYLVERGMAGNPQLVKMSAEYSLLDVIEQYDLDHGTDNYKFLREWIRSERRTSVVADRLCMHRNNVKHRVDRLEALFGIKLDEPDVRLRFSVAFAIRDSFVAQCAHLVEADLLQNDQ